jgi:DNA-directed RNA polymerase subunit omega
MSPLIYGGYRYETQNMIEELKSDRIMNKIGGKFKLTALIQKRMVELVQGSRPLIKDIEGMSMLEIVVQEILQEKITVDNGIATGSVQNTKDN